MTCSLLFLAFRLLQPEGAVFCTCSLPGCLKNINKDEFKRADCVLKLSGPHLKSGIQVLFSHLRKEAHDPKMMLGLQWMKSSSGTDSSTTVLSLIVFLRNQQDSRGISKAIWLGEVESEESGIQIWVLHFIIWASLGNFFLFLFRFISVSFSFLSFSFCSCLLILSPLSLPPPHLANSQKFTYWLSRNLLLWAPLGWKFCKVRGHIFLFSGNCAVWFLAGTWCLISVYLLTEGALLSWSVRQESEGCPYRAIGSIN